MTPRGAADPRLPTFVIPGAGKSGTTSLFAWLVEHPEVGGAGIKEPGFFTRERGIKDGGGPDAATQSGRYDLGLDWYRALYDGTEAAAARGEASTLYMPAADTPDLLLEVVPEVTLIFLLRDPVARLHSQYWQESKHGWELPAFDELVRGDHPRFRRHARVSRYDEHLERYLARFSREQVHVYLYEDLVADPRALVARAYAAIGVDPAFVPPSIGRRHNAAAAPRFRGLERLLSAPLGRSDVSRLPGWIRRPAGRLRRRLSRLNRRPVEYEPMSAELRRELVQRFEPTIAWVEGHLGRPLPGWRRVGDEAGGRR